MCLQSIYIIIYIKINILEKEISHRFIIKLNKLNAIMYKTFININHLNLKCVILCLQYHAASCFAASSKLPPLSVSPWNWDSGRGLSRIWWRLCSIIHSIHSRVAGEGSVVRMCCTCVSCHRGDAVLICLWRAWNKRAERVHTRKTIPGDRREVLASELPD